MFMFLGSILFGLIFILISPSSRAFLQAAWSGGSAWLTSWAPMSFILVAILLAAPIAAIVLIRTWPVHVEPENPMAKYRRDPMDEVE